MEAYEILTGVGTLYIAPAGEAKPDLDDAPAGNWVSVGETDGGVKVTKMQNIEAFSSDQRTGKVKAIRTEEGLTVETNLLQGTLENLVNVINGTVTDTPAGVGAVGFRSLPMYAGATVEEYALLFRGKSPYGATFIGQFYVPRGYMDDDVEMEFTKEGKVLIPVKFEALEDLDAANEEDRFGTFDYQDAAAS